MEARTGAVDLIAETSPDPHTALRELLYADERWRDWARVLMRTGVLKRDLLAKLWHIVLEFDHGLAEYAVNPLPIGEPAVIVAGSGKETFQTFNVSTAASILATAAGARVVKGVSRSVSAVSGSADVLDDLGVPITSNPLRVQEALDFHGIAFVSYAAFCPTYAGRYDGVFPFLTPFSFFMPVSVLGVRASAFVYGIAHRDVVLAAETIHTVRPDLACGLVVATDIAPGETMDEYAGYGISHTARLSRGRISAFRGTHTPPPVSWKTAVAHRNNHRANANLLAAALRSEGSRFGTELVERNAALILTAAQEKPDEIAALARVREARISGKAAQLLSRLQTQDAEVN